MRIIQRVVINNMEIKERVEIARPSWAKDPGRFVDLLLSNKKWNFEYEEDSNNRFDQGKQHGNSDQHTCVSMFAIIQNADVFNTDKHANCTQKAICKCAVLYAHDGGIVFTSISIRYQRRL